MLDLHQVCLHEVIHLIRLVKYRQQFLGLIFSSDIDWTVLTHWGRNQMDAFSQTTFSHAFSWMKMYEFRLTFHWSLFRINNIPTLIQIMAWRRPGDKPLSEPMMVKLLTHLCITRPQWVKIPVVTHWHRSNTGLSSTQYEQIPITLGVWPFWLTPFFFRSITFWRAYG